MIEPDAHRIPVPRDPTWVPLQTFDHDVPAEEVQAALSTAMAEHSDVRLILTINEEGRTVPGIGYYTDTLCFHEGCGEVARFATGKYDLVFAACAEHVGAALVRCWELAGQQGAYASWAVNFLMSQSPKA